MRRSSISAPVVNESPKTVGELYTEFEKQDIVDELFLQLTEEVHDASKYLYLAEQAKNLEDDELVHIFLSIGNQEVVHAEMINGYLAKSVIADVKNNPLRPLYTKLMDDLRQAKEDLSEIR